MTGCAMDRGMLPMAVGLGEAGSQTAPLGRAVIGGLTGGTIATLIILPAIFTLLQGEHTRKSASLLPANRGGSDAERSRLGNIEVAGMVGAIEAMREIY